MSFDRRKNGRLESVVRCESQRRTSVTFGHDALSRSTAYTELSAGRKTGERRRTFPTPPTAEIVPPAFGRTGTSTIRNDYHDFSRFNKAMHFNDPFPETKDVLSVDSVSDTQFGRHYRMLTRPQVDFRPPVNNIQPANMTAWMAKSISPAVRAHPIWRSEYESDLLDGSENDQQFVWHARHHRGE